MLNMMNVAALGYEAYRKARLVEGDVQPLWESLSPSVQHAWIEAASMVLDVSVRAAMV